MVGKSIALFFDVVVTTTSCEFIRTHVVDNELNYLLSVQESVAIVSVVLSYHSVGGGWCVLAVFGGREDFLTKNRSASFLEKEAVFST